LRCFAIVAEIIVKEGRLNETLSEYS
jgi:hypothetical protein